MGDDLVQRHFVLRLRRGNAVSPLEHRGQALRICGSETTELEGQQVHLDRDAIELDRLLDGRALHRQ